IVDGVVVSQPVGVMRPSGAKPSAVRTATETMSRQVRRTCDEGVIVTVNPAPTTDGSATASGADLATLVDVGPDRSVVEARSSVGGGAKASSPPSRVARSAIAPVANSTTVA